MSFSGADVDGLDRVAAECREGAQVCDEVRMVCEAIVAAASFFGPFGAAFIAYLKGVVIPWLTRISHALTLFARVLSAHSAAQRDASSSATSLPDYVTPDNLPAGNTSDYPTLPLTTATTSTDSYLFGLVTVRHDAAGAVSDVTLHEPGLLVSETNHFHIDRDSDGGVTGITTDGSASVLGGVVSAQSQGVITPIYHADGLLSGISAEGTTDISAGDTDLAQIRDRGQLNYADGLPGVFSSARFDMTGAYSADGNPIAATPATSSGGLGLPAHVTPSGVPSPTNDGLHFTPAGGQFALSASLDPQGGNNYLAGSADAHSQMITGGLSGSGGSAAAGSSAGYAVSGGAELHAQGFLGNDTQANSGAGVSGGLFSADAGLGGVTGGVGVNSGDSGGYVTAGWGPGVGAGGYVLQSGNTVYSGVNGDVGEFNVGVGANGPATPTGHSQPQAEPDPK